MGKKEFKENDKEYHIPESLEIEYCAAVLGVVIRNHPKAKELYENVKYCTTLPGVLDSYKVTENIMPDGGELIKDIVKEAELEKISKSDGNPVKIAECVLKGAFNIATANTKKIFSPILVDSRRRHDLQLSNKSIETFIRVCFNNESERAKRKYKIIGRNSQKLYFMIYIKTMYETNERFHNIIKNMIKMPTLKHGKKVYNAENIVDWKIPALAQRDLIRKYIELGLKRVHRKDIETTAWRWYQCRVVYDGPTAYYYKQLKQTSQEDPVVVLPENLVHELKEFDKALGYPREKTGKRKQ